MGYQETNNLEWYDPAAVTTANGSMVITLSRHEEYNLDYQSGEGHILPICRVRRLTIRIERRYGHNMVSFHRLLLSACNSESSMCSV